MGAKDWSLVSKIVSVLWIVVGSVLKGLGILHDLSAWDILLIGIVVAAIFATVDINILADKFLGGQAKATVEKIEAAVKGE